MPEGHNLMFSVSTPAAVRADQPLQTTFTMS
eukprot:SAG22_NODE_274_length_13178_cov_17.793715_9_plen_31_part_00